MSLLCVVSTKLSHVEPENTYDKFNASLTRSLQTMGIERADLFFLHSQLIEDGHVLSHYNELRYRIATPLTYFMESVIPAFSMPVEIAKYLR